MAHEFVVNNLKIASTPASTSANDYNLVARNTNGVFQLVTLGSGLSINGSGQLEAAGGGGGTPGGANTQVQFNDSSAFGGDSTFVFNKTDKILTSNRFHSSLSADPSGSVTDGDLYYNSTALDYRARIGSQWINITRPEIVIDSTTSRTLTAADRNKIIYFTNSATITVTGNNISTGFTVTLVKSGTGNVVFAPGSGLTLQAINDTISTQYGWASFAQQSSTVWTGTGALGVPPGTGTVTSVNVSGGSTGLAFSGGPVTTSGTITAAGTLAVNSGGTGLTSLGTANQLIRVNTGATALEYFTPSFLTGNQTITLTGEVTGSGSTSIATTIANNAVTFAKIQNLTTNRLLGRSTAGTGLTEQITPGNGIVLASGNLTLGGSLTSNATITTTGFGVVFSGGSVAMTDGTRQLSFGAGSGTVIDLGSDGTGDLHYRGSSGYLARLPIGTANQVLTVSGSLPAWVTPTAFTLSNGSGTTASGSAVNLGGALSSNATITGANTLILSNYGSSVGSLAVAPSGITYAATNAPFDIGPSGTSSVTVNPGNRSARIIGTVTAGVNSAIHNLLEMSTSINNNSKTGVTLRGIYYHPTFSSGAVANHYALAIASGNSGFGTISPTALVHVAAGTATSGTAPIKLTTGTALTTPEDGALEYHSSHLFFTVGSNRYQLDRQLTVGSAQYQIPTTNSTTNDYVYGNLNFNPSTDNFWGGDNGHTIGGSQNFTWGNNNINNGIFGSFISGELSEIDSSVGAAFIAGENNYVGEYGGMAIGRGVCVKPGATYSHIGGWYSPSTLSGKTNLKAPQVSGTGSFGFYETNSSQTDNHGVNASSSAILGGRNHNIPSTSPRSVILGGDGIKARASTPDMVYVPSLNVGTDTDYVLLTKDTLQKVNTASNSTFTILADGSTGGAAGGDIQITGGFASGGGVGGRIILNGGQGSSYGDVVLNTHVVRVGNAADTTIDFGVLGTGGTSFTNQGQNMAIVAGGAYTPSGNGNGGSITIQTGQRRTAGSGTDGNITLDALTGYLILANLPTSSAGLPSGAVWKNGSVLNIV